MTLYSLILTIHIATATLLIITVLFADHLAFAWLRGKKETLSKQTMYRIHYGMYLGLSIMIATGSYMFLPIREYLLQETAFQVKMAFLAALLVNSIFIGQTVHTSTTQRFTSLVGKTKLLFLISGGVSAGSWIGVIIAANFLSV